MQAPPSDWKPGDPIGYIRSDAPAFELPSYRGERYEALVPDTLDLQDRARLVLNCMTEATNPLADYETYGIVFFLCNPPQMQMDWGGPTAVVKFQEGVPLARMICGSDQNLHVERRWMEITLKSLADDGLIYTPIRGRPWTYRRGPRAEGPNEGQLLVPFICGRMLSTMSVYAYRDGGSLWRDAVRRLVDGLLDLAIYQDDIAYFWPSTMEATKERPSGSSPSTSGWGGGESSRVPQGLVNAYRLLGYEPALPLARKILNYLRSYFFAEDGTFWSEPNNPIRSHFHSHSHALQTMLEYATVVDDPEMIDFVVRSYEWARSWGTNAGKRTGSAIGHAAGATLLGYFPETLFDLEWEASEICEVADMISLAMKLSEAGAGDYWDDADRWIRNMFAEGQITSTDWVYRIQEIGLVNPDVQHILPAPVDAYATGDRVAERNLGAFGGYSSANDLFPGHGAGITHCCTATASHTIYRIWERIQRYEAGKLRVNLLLNHASRWADIDSYIPYTGRVDLKIKQPVDLSIRIPEWATPQETLCQVDGETRSPGWDGRYAVVGSVKPGQVASLRFPIPTRTDVVHIEKERFTLLRKGNDVIEIAPPGRWCPLYQRQHYKDNEPRWRKVTRFVSEERIEW